MRATTGGEKGGALRAVRREGMAHLRAPSGVDSVRAMLAREALVAL